MDDAERLADALMDAGATFPVPEHGSNRDALVAFLRTRETPPDLEGLRAALNRIADITVDTTLTDNAAFRDIRAVVRAALHPEPRQPDTQEAEK